MKIASRYTFLIRGNCLKNFSFFWGLFFSSHKIFVLSRRNLFRINIYLAFPQHFSFINFTNKFFLRFNDILSFPFFFKKNKKNFFNTLVKIDASFSLKMWECCFISFFYLNPCCDEYICKKKYCLEKNIDYSAMKSRKIFLWSINHNMIKVMRFLNWTAFLHYKIFWLMSKI